MIDGHNWIGWEKQIPTKWERYRWENAIYEEKKRIKQVVSKIENGNPSIRTFYAYCRAIGVIWYKNERAKYERKEILWNIKKDINPKQNSKNF